MGESAVEDWQVAKREENVSDLLGFLLLSLVDEIEHFVVGPLELSFEVCMRVDREMSGATGVVFASVLDLSVGSRGGPMNWLLAGLGV